jgi:hypothetical protein
VAEGEGGEGGEGYRREEEEGEEGEDCKEEGREASSASMTASSQGAGGMRRMRPSEIRQTASSRGLHRWLSCAADDCDGDVASLLRSGEEVAADCVAASCCSCPWALTKGGAEGDGADRAPEWDEVEVEG